MNINGKTKLLGIIGNPIGHSFSPQIHNSALSHLALDYVYLPFPVAPAKLSEAVLGFEAISLVGFSVTIPHKQAIIPFLKEISPLAQVAGAVNTVCWKDTGWYGTNTDIAGFLSPLLSLERNWQEIVPVILGCGGAARAVVVAAQELGCPSVHVVSRNQDKLKDFQASWRSSMLQIEIQIHSWESIKDLISQTALLINTTPIGMYPVVDISPVEQSFWENIKPDLIVYDLIYRPSPTLFLQEAAGQGAFIITGTEMLINQAAEAFKIWTGQTAPIDVMNQELYHQLCF